MKIHSLIWIIVLFLVPTLSYSAINQCTRFYSENRAVIQNLISFEGDAKSLAKLIGEDTQADARSIIFSIMKESKHKRAVVKDELAFGDSIIEMVKHDLSYLQSLILFAKQKPNEIFITTQSELWSLVKTVKDITISTQHLENRPDLVDPEQIMGLKKTLKEFELVDRQHGFYKRFTDSGYTLTPTANDVVKEPVPLFWKEKFRWFQSALALGNLSYHGAKGLDGFYSDRFRQRMMNHNMHAEAVKRIQETISEANKFIKEFIETFDLNTIDRQEIGGIVVRIENILDEPNFKRYKEYSAKSILKNRRDVALLLDAEVKIFGDYARLIKEPRKGSPGFKSSADDKAVELYDQKALADIRNFMIQAFSNSVKILYGVMSISYANLLEGTLTRTSRITSENLKTDADSIQELKSIITLSERMLEKFPKNMFTATFSMYTRSDVRAAMALRTEVTRLRSLLPKTGEGT